MELPEVIIRNRIDYTKSKIKFTDKQREGVEDLVWEAVRQGITIKEQIAYILATAWHETAQTMQPISEYGSDKYLSKYDTGKLAKDLGNSPGADGDGILYKGRGYVMITGKSNYDKFSKILDIDLVKNPEKAKEPQIAAQIAVYGMIHGSFTTKKLSDYITSTKVDYLNARRVINGQDKAVTIQGYAQEFNKILL